MPSDLLVTGFEAFPGVDRNPSAAIALDFAERSVDAVILPVTRAAGDLAAGLVEKDYDAILHFGVNTHIKRLELERYAVNLYDSDKPDNDGYMAVEEPIADGPLAYMSSMPLRSLAETLKTQGVPCAVSNSAGTYICNLVYYRSLHAAAGLGLRTRICFVHVPDMPEEILVGWCRHLAEALQS